VEIRVMVFLIKTLSLRSYGVYTVNRKVYTYEIIKFDSLLNVERIQSVQALRGGLMSCSCYANKFDKCKHRALVLLFDLEKRTNKKWFYDWDTQRWYLPYIQ